MNDQEREFTLRCRGDQIVLRFADGHDEVPVRLVWARPVTGRGEEISGQRGAVRRHRRRHQCLRRSGPVDNTLEGRRRVRA